jgi:hypothetical protein
MTTRDYSIQKFIPVKMYAKLEVAALLTFKNGFRTGSTLMKHKRDTKVYL